MANKLCKSCVLATHLFIQTRKAAIMTDITRPTVTLTPIATSMLLVSFVSVSGNKKKQIDMY